MKKNNLTERRSYFNELVDAANDFCLLIEHVDIYENKEWLCDIGRLLARLHVSMTHLDDRSIEYSYFSVPDLGERFELYCKLSDKLGESDAYLLEYDTHDNVNDMTGSLAGDFADIYFDSSVTSSIRFDVTIQALNSFFRCVTSTNGRKSYHPLIALRFKIAHWCS